MYCLFYREFKPYAVRIEDIHSQCVFLSFPLKHAKHVIQAPASAFPTLLKRESPHCGMQAPYRVLQLSAWCRLYDQPDHCGRSAASIPGTRGCRGRFHTAFSPISK
jgi:hypothetical protein